MNYSCSHVYYYYELLSSVYLQISCVEHCTRAYIYVMYSFLEETSSRVEYGVFVFRLRVSCRIIIIIIFSRNSHNPSFYYLASEYKMHIPEYRF